MLASIKQVSNLGNVRSYNNKNKECRLLSPNKQQKGYETVTLKGNINPAILLMTPTEHNRFEHYSHTLRKES